MAACRGARERPASITATFARDDHVETARKISGRDQRKRRFSVPVASTGLIPIAVRTDSTERGAIPISFAAAFDEMSKLILRKILSREARK